MSFSKPTIFVVVVVVVVVVSKYLNLTVCRIRSYGSNKLQQHFWVHLNVAINANHSLWKCMFETFAHVYRYFHIDESANACKLHTCKIYILCM